MKSFTQEQQHVSDVNLKSAPLLDTLSETCTFLSYQHVCSKSSGGLSPAAVVRAKRSLSAAPSLQTPGHTAPTSRSFLLPASLEWVWPSPEDSWQYGVNIIIINSCIYDVSCQWCFGRCVSVWCRCSGVLVGGVKVFNLQLPPP